MGGGLGIFGGGGGGLDLGFGGLSGLGGPVNAFYTAPRSELLSAANGRGMEITGTWTRRGGSIFFELTFTNKALGIMGDLAIMFNKNRYVKLLIMSILVVAVGWAFLSGTECLSSGNSGPPRGDYLGF